MANNINESMQTEKWNHILTEALSNATDAIGMSTPAGVHYYQNKAFYQLFGDIGKDPTATLYADKQQGVNIFNTLMAGGRWTGEVKMYDKNINIVDIFLRAFANKDENGTILSLVGIHTDITERKQFETEKKEWQSLMQYIVRHDPNAIAVLDKELRHIYVSDRFLNDYHVNAEDVIGKHHYTAFPDIPDKWKDIHQRALNGEIARSDDDIFVRYDGSIDYTRWECRPWYLADGSVGGIILYTEVITNLKKTEKALQQQLEEKELMLKEVHHRIKNNISSIKSLLNLQANNIEQDNAKDVIIDAISRVESMHQIYKKLLISNSYDELPVKGYLEDLIKAVIKVFPGPTNISIETDIDDVYLCVKKLSHIGTIINELINNSMKHAFENKESGMITIILKIHKKTLTVTVLDDGIGLPKKFDIDTTSGFGLMLVKMLTQQLKGTFSIESSKGTQSVVSFKT